MIPQKWIKSVWKLNNTFIQVLLYEFTQLFTRIIIYSAALLCGDKKFCHDLPLYMTIFRPFVAFAPRFNNTITYSQVNLSKTIDKKISNAYSKLDRIEIYSLLLNAFQIIFSGNLIPFHCIPA